jgi:putative hydrolase of HD superfamily
MDKETGEKIKRFISEVEALKRVEHMGVKLAGLEKVDSVAEHVLVSAQIAYVLAKLEGADAQKCAVMNIFHDNEEVRLGDRHKVAKRYLETKQAERQAEQEHFSNLPSNIAEVLFALQEEKRAKTTKEAIIAKEADLLEMVAQAKIYQESGFQGCKYWISELENVFQTESAKAIFRAIVEDSDFLNSWWKPIPGILTQKD